ncbi:MAG: sulfurtransferase-like selenium metabolism protein YedF [Bacteroidales bacterium]|jgi:selenium metabolism protein YedF|nr:sulfurtransferase-like selenium metabolism protein YedF [Bacteroidales bacterium]HOA09025.1 sulfurtransferase-like selenium metabolism protein YedF [Tenuifilaceae bacterium]HOC35856.1 sulfurtransferase-like selenium metabolism protein YedF [Tenuifilaceae bacterium]HOG71358.1 sulfurtransferase-like selenium metabolism protein YedF [Tenuifilaceae bacterium]HPA66735.1 sulfurtransferase-like selenium metabolism protein YedF [Tenuifilaceae bacterium]
MAKLVDCRGMVCPQPLVETRREIKKSNPGEAITVVVDNSTSLKNILRFLEDNGVECVVKQEAESSSITFNVPLQMTQPDKRAEEYCDVSPKPDVNSGFIVLLNSATMGKGNDELGKILMKGFLSTLLELKATPTEIICYNSAVTLALKSSDTAATLQQISERGIKITLCGTCVDFYNLRDDLAVGQISNMLYIAERLSSGVRIIQP